MPSSNQTRLENDKESLQNENKSLQAAIGMKNEEHLRELEKMIVLREQIESTSNFVQL